jgi:benzoate transport
MGALQILIVILLVLLNALDGFDVLAITFAAPGISEDWEISLSALGVVIAASVIGMAVGSVFLAPMADRIGRRPTILICLCIMAVGMLLTATADSIAMLSAWRIFTGVGIGGMIPAITAASAEFSNNKRRDLAVSAMTIGYPLGGLIGGFMSAGLVDYGGWRAIFVAGGLATAAFIPIVWLALPESLEFLAARGGSNALSKINVILNRLGHPSVEEARAGVMQKQSADPRALFGPDLRMLTFLLVSAYFLHIMAFYFFTGWLPKIMTDAGYATSVAIATSAITSTGGVLGGIFIGLTSPYIGLKRLAVTSMAGTSVMMAVFAMSTGNLNTLRIAAFVLGIFMMGGIVGLYAFLARAFPARLRVTGCGLAIAMGRAGGIVGPILGGVLLDLGLRAGSVLTVIGITAAVGALFLLPVRLREHKD